MKKSVCVLFGGMSSEHEVSLMTARSILDNIDRSLFDVYPVGITKSGRWLYFGGAPELLTDSGWENSGSTCPALLSPSVGDGLILHEPLGKRRVAIDCVFPALHGENGEDGAPQGLCQLAGIPCVGAGIGASAVAMDKDFTKAVVSRLGIRQAKYIAIERGGCDAQEAADRAEKILGGYPVFIKPASTGSSVGVSKAKNRQDFIDGLAHALEFDHKAIVEEFFDGREIEVAVMGNTDLNVSCCGEIIPGEEFYSYADKYVNALSSERIPADLPPETSDAIRKYAAEIYRELGCAGLSRVDFFVHKRTGEVCFNEINTIPGFTPISMYPKLFMHGGMSYPEIITRLITLACEG